MIFSGSHIRPVSPDGAIDLPHDWNPEDGRFCAFVAPRSHPVAIALHPAAMADILRENLPIANRQTGLAMVMSMLEVVACQLRVPRAMRDQASLGAMVVLVGKGGHVLIHGHSEGQEGSPK